MKDRIRIKDIAIVAGVSPGTVDRVLHKRGNVSKKSEEKVLKALESLDYSPNVLASVLAYNKEWKIAALIPNEYKDSFWNQPKDGILKALQVVKDYGVTVDFFHFMENNEEEFVRQSEAILEKTYNCVIVSPIFTEQSISFLKKCDQKDIHYVLINTYLDLEDSNLICYIGQDSYHSGTLGAKLLAFGLSAGESAMICHVEELVYNSQHLIDKERGFKDYFKEHHDLGINVITGHFENPYDTVGMYNFFKKHLTKCPNIKGIFISTSRAFHVVNALKKLGISDLKLVGYDLIDENLTYLESEEIDFLINQNPFKQGYLAVINIFNFLIRKIEPNKLQHLPLDVVMKENANYYTDRQFEEMPIVM
ncbi:substrate-binding domain-containing protein [Portibacter lacus]|uniref:Transcriptional regulator n=1 Tax=Portibacter lacus TaxID=1099794 RepID=A0AA37WE49_9BACT|nr:substrate-binding domain-containing protein [Portibacter lacus]GLR15855.1 transcriptional regulator [Portibacter lacus]